LILALGACGTSLRAVQSGRWDRAHTTQEGFENDRRHCLRGATQTGTVLTYPQVDVDRFAACMSARGYTRSDTGQFGQRTQKPDADREK
jgi:hypothetical protein